MWAAKYCSILFSSTWNKLFILAHFLLCTATATAQFFLPTNTLNSVLLQVVRQLKVKKCKCHGKSDACTYKTCWYVSPTIKNVGDKIWKLYENSVRSQWNRTTKVLFEKDRPKRDQSQGLLDSKLTYFTRSENFCVQNLAMGVMGTYGRTCNSTSQGNDGCNTMCCNRPHQKTYVTKQKKCNCKFVWCCDVKCETCNTTEVVETCL